MTLLRIIYQSLRGSIHRTPYRSARQTIYQSALQSIRWSVYKRTRRSIRTSIYPRTRTRLRRTVRQRLYRTVPGTTPWTGEVISPKSPKWIPRRLIRQAYNLSVAD
jgi:hypothetical protein